MKKSSFPPQNQHPDFFDLAADVTGEDFSLDVPINPFLPREEFVWAQDYGFNAPPGDLL